jgi:hypothetical protein
VSENGAGTVDYATADWENVSNAGGGAQANGGGGRGPGADDFIGAVIKLLAAATRLTGPINPICDADLNAVGTNWDQISKAASSINILNGWGNQANYADSIWGTSSAWGGNKATYGAQSVGDFMASHGGTAAVSQAFGHDIYVDPTWVNSFSDNQTAALLLHELVHNVTGQVDSTLQSDLGLPDGNSVNIANKLQVDCFGI